MKSAALLLVIALAFRLVGHAQLAADADTSWPIVDAEAYLLQALAVADGADLSDEVYFQAPLYPWVLGLTLRVAGVPGACGLRSLTELPRAQVQRALDVARRLNLAFGLLAVLLAWRLGCVALGASGGLCAGLLLALCGTLVVFEGLALKASLSLLFLPWAALAALRALRLGGARPWIWVGLALGLGGLVRGNLHALTLLGAATLAIVGLRAGRMGEGLRRASLLLAGAGLALAPVVVRNSLVAGRPVLSTAAGGTAFYLCNHPDNATGMVQYRAHNRQVPRHEFADWKREAEQATGAALTPAQVSRYWFLAALDGIAQRPGTWLLAQTRKLALLASRYEAPDNLLPAFNQRTSALLAASPVGWGLLFPLACGGLAFAWLTRRSWPRPRGLGLVLALGAGYAATLLLFVVTSRFRLPLVPLLVVPAAGLLVGLRALAGPAVPWNTRLLVAAAVLGGLGLTRAAEGPLGPLDARELAEHEAVALRNRAEVALERGDDGRAEADLRAALATVAAVDRASPDLHLSLGRIERLRAQRALADGAPPAQLLAHRQASRAELGAGLQLNERHGGLWRELGLLLYEADRHDEAATAFAQALAIWPRDREATQYRALALLQAGRGAEAEAEARVLVEDEPGSDDGWGLLAWALALQQRPDEARAALERYEAAAAVRESQGRPRRLPPLPIFAELRRAP